MNTTLPYFLTVDGKEREIFADFRNIVNILVALNDSDISDFEKNAIMLNNLYVEDWRTFTDIEEATKRAVWFLDGGKEYTRVPEKTFKIIDWENDYNLICSAVNTKANVLDVRQLKHLHWWTFLDYFAESGESRFTVFAGIRDKLNKGKKLEKYEKEILRANREEIIIKSEKIKEFEKKIWGVNKWQKN